MQLIMYWLILGNIKIKEVIPILRKVILHFNFQISLNYIQDCVIKQVILCSDKSG
jgi:hypothetical protein